MVVNVYMCARLAQAGLYWIMADCQQHSVWQQHSVEAGDRLHGGMLLLLGRTHHEEDNIQAVGS